MTNVGLSMIGALLLLIIVLIIVLAYLKPKPVRRLPKYDDRTEHFFNSADGAFVDDNSHAIKGRNLQTDQMLFNRGQSKVLLNDVATDKYYAEPGTLGASKNTNSFDSLLERQQRIQKLHAKGDGNVMTQNDMKEINKLMLASGNNANFNLFNRAGSANVKFDLDPSGTRGIIDADYLPDRDRNHTISAVNKVVPIPGFDVSVDTFPTQIAKQMRGKNGINAAGKVRKNSGESALKNATGFGLQDTIDNSNKSIDETRQNFEKYRGNRGVVVFGNYNM